MGLKSLILKPLVLYLYSQVNKSDVKDIVISDLHLWSTKQFGEIRNEKSFFLNKMLGDPKFRSLFYHRYKCPAIIKKLLPSALFFNINPMTEIPGGGLYLVHPWCTRVGARRIGQNCIIRHMTTIGTNGNPQMEKLTPIIGDNVDIGCMCGIFGNITIGNNVKIGAGTIITKNVPDNCVVVGNPARIIKLNGESVNIAL